MATWSGERDGVKGTYLDSPFFPRFFPDTEEGRSRLRQQIDIELMFAKVMIAVIGIACAGLFAFAVRVTWGL